jgi:hypothetical protein
MIIQLEPSHWTPGRWHRPSRCLICLAEKLYVRLGLASYEDD